MADDRVPTDTVTKRARTVAVALLRDIVRSARRGSSVMETTTLDAELEDDELSDADDTMKPPTRPQPKRDLSTLWEPAAMLVNSVVMRAPQEECETRAHTLRDVLYECPPGDSPTFPVFLAFCPTKKKNKKKKRTDSKGRLQDEDFRPDGAGSDASQDKDEDERPAKKEKKDPSVPKPPSKSEAKDGDKEGVVKKKKQKKDPNAPKKPLSAFMCFSHSERETVKKENPGIEYTDLGKALGEKWRKLTAEGKEPYEAKARLDKQRYIDEMKDYNKNRQRQDSR